ncbi:MAG: hypothetical protein M1314_03535 [Firmicutes bacterium]|nr:hypothetical protein [Bacillota bacterium]
MYDAFQPAPNYSGLEDAVRNISGTYMHIGGGRWFVDSQLSSQQIAERLAPLTYQGDQILVFRLERDWYGYGFTPEQDTWLKQRNYSNFWETLAKLPPLPVPKPAASFSNAIGGLLGLARGVQ